MRLNKIKLNKEKHISKHVKQINQIKSNKNTKKKIQTKEKSWRETHLTYGTQLDWYLTGPLVPTQQYSMR